MTPSYSRAFYILGFMAVERDEWAVALEYIDKGLALELDHPLLLAEKAMIVSRMKRFEEAVELFMKAVDIPWALPYEKAKSLRGAAVVLIDMNRLDDAEELLRRSLEIEPDNQVALGELRYITHLRGGGDATDKYDLV